MESYQLLFKKIELIKELEDCFDEECSNFERYEDKEQRKSNFNSDDFKKSLIYTNHDDKLKKINMDYKLAVDDAYSSFRETIPMILIDKINYNKDEKDLVFKYTRYRYHRNTRNPTDSRLISAALFSDIKELDD